VRRLSGRVEFDLGGVRYLNSSGVRNWITFLRRLGNVTEHSFIRCSVAFIAQASMVPAVLGRGRVVSLWAPYHCDRCDRTDERLLHVAALLDRSLGSKVTPPRFSVGQCGGELFFDDLPERYFAFVQT
jgi:hypothetical protein